MLWCSLEEGKVWILSLPTDCRVALWSLISPSISHPNLHLTTKARQQHRELHALLFAISVWVLNLSSGTVIGKVTPISYISKCHPLKSDAPSIRWHLIFFSCPFVDVLLSFLHHVALISQHLPQFTPFLYFTQLRFAPLFWAVVYWLLVKAILYLTLIVQKKM